MAEAVDREHHSRSLEPLETEHVAIEDLLGVPEPVPIGDLPLLVERPARGAACRSSAVPRRGRPAFLQEPSTSSSAGSSAASASRHETHRQAVPTAIAHPGGPTDRRSRRWPPCSGRSHRGRRHQRDRRTTLAGEDPLTLIAEDVQPPSSGSRSAARSAGHHESAKSCASSTTMASKCDPAVSSSREVSICDGRRFSQKSLSSSPPARRPPRLAKAMEGPDVRRLLVALPAGGVALQVRGEATRIAGERNPFPSWSAVEPAQARGTSSRCRHRPRC